MRKISILQQILTLKEAILFCKFLHENSVDRKNKVDHDKVSGKSQKTVNSDFWFLKLCQWDFSPQSSVFFRIWLATNINDQNWAFQKRQYDQNLAVQKRQYDQNLDVYRSQYDQNLDVCRRQYDHNLTGHSNFAKFWKRRIFPIGYLFWLNFHRSVLCKWTISFPSMSLSRC